MGSARHNISELSCFNPQSNSNKTNSTTCAGMGNTQEVLGALRAVLSKLPARYRHWEDLGSCGGTVICVPARACTSGALARRPFWPYASHLLECKAALLSFTPKSSACGMHTGPRWNSAIVKWEMEWAMLCSSKGEGQQSHRGREGERGSWRQAQ